MTAAAKRPQSTLPTPSPFGGQSPRLRERHRCRSAKAPGSPTMTARSLRLGSCLWVGMVWVLFQGANSVGALRIPGANFGVFAMPKFDLGTALWTHNVTRKVLEVLSKSKAKSCGSDADCHGQGRSVKCRAPSFSDDTRLCLTFIECRRLEGKVKDVSGGDSIDGCQMMGEDNADKCFQAAESVAARMKAARNASNRAGEGGSNLRNTVYCFMVAHPTNYELVRMHMTLRTLALCDGYNFVSNVSTLRPPGNETGPPLPVTPLIEGAMEAPRGGAFGTALNARPFMQVWTKLALEARVHEKYDFIVKVDPDTALLPRRLKFYLQRPDPNRPLILANARIRNQGSEFNHVDGSLIVTTKAALAQFATKLEEKNKSWQEVCHKWTLQGTLQTMLNEDMVGEDTFIHECFVRALGVQREPAPTLSFACIRGWGCELGTFQNTRCTAVDSMSAGSFHPFKDACKLMRCWLGAHEAWHWYLTELGASLL